MTFTMVHRPARTVLPARKPAPVTLAAPPQLGDGQATGGARMQGMLPVLGAVSSMTMMMTMRSNPMFVAIGALVMVVAVIGGVAMMVSQRGQAARGRRAQRERYLDYLESTQTELEAHERTTLRERAATQPAPEALPVVVLDPARRWERRRRDPDFLHLRLGLGAAPLIAVTVPADNNPSQPYDPLILLEAEQLAARFGQAPASPIAVDLDRAGSVAIVGERDDTTAVVRALIAQAAAFHAPDDLSIGAVYAPEHAGQFAGLDLLPHANDALASDGPVPARRIAATTAGLAKVLRPELTASANRTAQAVKAAGAVPGQLNGRLLVIIDDHGRVARGLPLPDASVSPSDLGLTTIHLVSDRLAEPGDTAIRITVAGRDARIEFPQTDAAPLQATVDELTPEMLTGLARALAPLRLSSVDAVELGTSASVDITTLLGVEDVVNIPVARHWQPRSPRDFLRVPIGIDDRGEVLRLDLKESAQLGMGPHGLCVGATGSGKSEMLRTMVAALAISHPPEDLAMILVDYKGGAAFAPFETLPHVAGVMDNLADDAGLTERARASIQGEVVRRQQLLRDAGNFASITHYRAKRAEDPNLPALPHLLLVIDEFGELLTAEPDFVELLLTIGRIGRSIGVHLLLSSQRIEGGRLRGLDTYLSYRLGLRTFSEGESSTVLDTPDAFHLPAIPGYGYLKVDTSVYQRFRAGYVSGPLADARTEAAPELRDLVRRALVLPTHNGILKANGLLDESSSDDGDVSVPSTARTVVQAVVEQLSAAAEPTMPVWLEPLPNRLTLDRAIRAQPEDQTAEFSVPMGLLDNPARQKQGAWLLDLAGSGGHVSITGAPQSGRSTFLTTLAASLALTFTPNRVAIYGLDLSGGGLSRIEGLPHVGGVATRGHRERIGRLMDELKSMLDERETLFQHRGLDSLTAMRLAHEAGRLPELAAADIVLLVDGTGGLREEFEVYEDDFMALLKRGSSFGLHVVMTLTRMNDLRMNAHPLVGTKLELRLNDPTDSSIDRKLSATLKANRPGRVLTPEKLFAHAALPLLDSPQPLAQRMIGAGLAELIEAARGSWTGPSAPPIRLLPVDLDPESLPDSLDEPEAVPVGLHQDTMTPALLDLVHTDPHLLIFGDTRSGKTTLLRGIIGGLVERAPAEELVIGLYDVRRGLVDICHEDYIGGHATSGQLGVGLSNGIAQELETRQTRLTEEGISPGSASLGARIVVVVDDYDILASGGTDPLRPLLPYLPSARDLRLHLIVARPASGASRSLYDPVLQAARETGGSALLMSGDPAEGMLFPGIRPTIQPPGRGLWIRRGAPSRITQIANFGRS